jgi:predicted DNA-binding helix-hairpin-helix protein
VKNGCIKPIGFMRFTALKPMKFSKNNPFLDLEVDPKMGWAAKHHTFSSNNSACTAGNDLRVPGIGVKSAQNCVCTPFSKSIDGTPQENLSFNRAKYFIVEVE